MIVQQPNELDIRDSSRQLEDRASIFHSLDAAPRIQIRSRREEDGERKQTGRRFQTIVSGINNIPSDLSSQTSENSFTAK